jgi:hypothetical protein
MAWILKQYAGALAGLVIGATVATITTMGIMLDPEKLAELSGVVECVKAQALHK